MPSAPPPPPPDARTKTRPPGTPPPLPPEVQRRQHERFEIQMSAEVQIGADTFTAGTRDLSEGGAGLDCDRALPEGAETTLGLFLVVDGVEEERFPPLWVKGRVAWCAEGDAPNRFVAGIRFEVITEDQKAWLRGVVSHLAQR